MTTELYIIRHGQSFGNVTPIITGPKGDEGLTPLGVKQAERLRDRLAATGEIQADVLLASTLPRAAQTAQIIAPALGLPILWDEDLQELRAADEMDGLSEEEALKTYEDPNFETNPLGTFFGGESFGSFMLRVANTLNRIVTEYADKRIVVVAHGGVVDGSFIYFSQMSSLAIPPIAFYTLNTSITHWRHEQLPHRSKPYWTLVKYNDDLHVRDIDTPERINWSALSQRPSTQDPSLALPTDPQEPGDPQTVTA